VIFPTSAFIRKHSQCLSLEVKQVYVEHQLHNIKKSNKSQYDKHNKKKKQTEEKEPHKKNKKVNSNTDTHTHTHTHPHSHTQEFHKIHKTTTTDFCTKDMYGKIKKFSNTLHDKELPMIFLTLFCIWHLLLGIRNTLKNNSPIRDNVYVWDTVCINLPAKLRDSFEFRPLQAISSL